MPGMDLVVTNGTLVTPGGLVRTDIGIDDASIAGMTEDLRGEFEIDAHGCYVLPGAIDPHVHLQMPVGDGSNPNVVSSDDFASGTRAAVLGGTTTVVDFVEPKPGETFIEALHRRQEDADGHVVIDYGLHMTIPAWHAARPQCLAQLSEVVAAGVSSFKLYTAYEGFRLDDTQLLDVVGAVREVGGLPMVHCENGPICEHLRAQALGQGKTAPIYHAVTRPPRQEAEAVSRVIDIAALAASPVYIAHVSCCSALSRIRTARARGESVYSETCPQYLFLDQSALMGPQGERLICAPPLRTAEDREALWIGLRRGDIDVVSTDHCPFQTATKEGHSDFTSVPGGLPSIEARLGLVYDALAERGMGVECLSELCSTRSAQIFGLGRKGEIAVGLDADLVIFDPQREVTIAAGETLHENVDWTPYAGLHIRGWARDVISRGELVVSDGQFVGHLGRGRFVPRTRTELR